MRDRENKKTYRVCFVAHPDDDALWFGNCELMFGFDIKIYLTYKPSDGRGREAISWSLAACNYCSLVFLEFADDIVTSTDNILDALKEEGIPSDVCELYTHNKHGEDWHHQHIAVHNAAMRYFKARRVIVPTYNHESVDVSIRFSVTGRKSDLFRRSFPSQFEHLARRLPRHVEIDYLDVLF